jgi:hypothetical protein
MSIKALEARAQALAAAQSKQEMPTSLPSPWQGAALVTNQLGDALATRRADQAAAARRQDLANIMGGIGPEGPNPGQLGQIASADPEIGKAYMLQIAQQRAAAQEIAARKEAAATKAATDEAGAVSQEERLKARPHSDIGQLTADVGRKPTEEEIQAEIKKKTSPSPTEQEAMGKAREENIGLQALNSQLDEADRLLQSGKVYSGSGAGYRTEYGQNVPKVLRGVAGVDPESDAASKRVKQILNVQAVQTLKAMKGSASNADRDFAIETVNDPSAPLANKQAAMKLLRAHIASSLQSSEQTLKGMGTAPVKVDIPAAGGTTAAPAAATGGAQSVASEAEALKLPPGTKFKLPDGRTGTAR